VAASASYAAIKVATVKVITGTTTLSGKSTGKVKDELTTVGGSKVECTGDSSTSTLSGESPVGSKEFHSVVKATVHFTGCTSTFGVGCEGGTGHAAKEIVTEPLKGTVADITTTEVGQELEPEAGSKFAGFSCAGIPVVVGNTKAGHKNGVIGKLSPLGKTTVAVLKFKQTTGVQEVLKFEGAAENSFLESSKNGGAFEQSGQTNEDEVKNGGEVEIKL
jgi:hypothetical protein